MRDRNRAEVTAKILEAARAEIAERGGVGLSMRAVARDAGLASSAIYRYFPTREALLTAMVIESYAHLDEALQQPEGWAALAHATRDWARAFPHEYQLIYGTPIPGYAAPPETIPSAERVARHFLEAVGDHDVAGFDTPELAEQMARLAGEDGSRSGAAAVLAELAALTGFVSLELAGHFVGTADPADALFQAMVARQGRTLGTH